VKKIILLVMMLVFLCGVVPVFASDIEKYREDEANTYNINTTLSRSIDLNSISKASSNVSISTLRSYSAVSVNYETLYVVGVSLINIGREIVYINDLAIGDVNPNTVDRHLSECIGYLNLTIDSYNYLNENKKNIISKAGNKKINVKDINTILSAYRDVIENYKLALDNVYSHEFDDSLEITELYSNIAYDYANNSFERYSYFMNLIQK